MPSKKSPVEKRPSKNAGTRAWMGYWSRHPKEKAEQEARAKARNERARLKRMAKHEPVLYDIQSNGKYVNVRFVRNGKVVYGTYELSNASVPEDFNRLELARFDRFRARVRADEAQAGPQPKPGKTPLS